MDKQKAKNCGGNALSLFYTLRKLVFEAFDSRDRHFTRTQQMILTVMENGKTFSMSELARMICTSNEQATRAVSQLVTSGFIIRNQNETNHRIVNIRLSDEGLAFMKEIRSAVEKSLTVYLFGSEKPDKKQLAYAAELIGELENVLAPVRK